MRAVAAESSNPLGRVRAGNPVSHDDLRERRDERSLCTGRARRATTISRALVATAASAAPIVHMRNPLAQPAGVNFNSRKNESLGGVASSSLRCEDFNHLLPEFIDSAEPVRNRAEPTQGPRINPS